MSMDFRPLANRLNEYLASDAGKEMLLSIPQGSERELFSYREGGFRRMIMLRPDGLYEDYYSVVQPKTRGEKVERLFDALHVIQGAWESEEYRSYAALEEDILRRFGVTAKAGSA